MSYLLPNLFVMECKLRNLCIICITISSYNDKKEVPSTQQILQHSKDKEILKNRPNRRLRRKHK